jgi:hypothetical protein
MSMKSPKLPYVVLAISAWSLAAILTIQAAKVPVIEGVLMVDANQKEILVVEAKGDNYIRETSFKLHNPGKESILFGKILASCGCTEASLGAPMLNSGGRTELNVRVNIEGKKLPTLMSVIVPYKCSALVDEESIQFLVSVVPAK